MSVRLASRRNRKEKTHLIITRSPLRITLGGGGTDLPSYYSNYGGFLMAAAIDRYVYINIHRRFIDGYLLKYSRLEEAETIDDIQHPIIRECLRRVGVPTNLEITSMADIPAGTGLGSSGSFTTALLKALSCYRKGLLSPQELAEEACRIEIDVLHEPVGKQDQFIAAYGGVTCLDFQNDGTTRAYALELTDETLFNLEDNLLLFFTGYSRSASVILKQQDDQSKQNDREMVANLHVVKQLGYQSKEALESGDLIAFGQLMDVHWQHKKRRSGKMSNGNIDRWYDIAIKNGAVGGKLIGAGGGGFLMFYAADKVRLRHVMGEHGLREVRFRFDFEGTKVLASD